MEGMAIDGQSAVGATRREGPLADHPDGAPAAPSAGPSRRVVVELRDLRREFADTVAVEGVTLEVAEGEIFGFIGPNGAGKTTTLRILATLLEPTSGRALIGGACVQEQAEEVRRRIGYMPDAFGVYEGITVEEYLDFFAAAFRIPSARRRTVVRDVMDLTDLTPIAGRLVAQLSRGMKQRLCLAKTLVHDPAVLILDEPASALDPRARIEMRELLKELRGMGKTILISSHILTELADLCTSVGIMEKGRLQFVGAIEEVRSRRVAAGRVVIRLHREEPAAAGLLASHPRVGVVEARGAELSFEYRGEPGDFHEVVKLLVDHRVPLLAIGQETSTLEGLFLDVTRGHVG